jgi:hypothetical protein
MKTVKSDSYRLSERVLISRGDRFKATGGPYWKSKDGTQVSLTSRGPYTFHAHVTRGAIQWIECLDKDGCFAVLHIAGRRKKIDGSMVTRPYKIVGKKRNKLDEKGGRR